MTLLSKAEIQLLCKKFNVNTKSSNCNKKCELIDKLIDNCQCQKNVISMFKKANYSLLTELQKQVITILGTCIKLNQSAKDTFSKVILLFSFPHFFNEEENKRLSNQLYMSIQIQENLVRYYPYKLSETLIFETRQDFEMYSAAVMDKERFEEAFISKDFDTYNSVSSEILKKFKKILSDEK